jgi:hypothetical protein
MLSPLTQSNTQDSNFPSLEKIIRFIFSYNIGKPCEIVKFHEKFHANIDFSINFENI